MVLSRLVERVQQVGLQELGTWERFGRHLGPLSNMDLGAFICRLGSQEGECAAEWMSGVVFQRCSYGALDRVCAL